MRPAANPLATALAALFATALAALLATALAALLVAPLAHPAAATAPTESPLAGERKHLAKVFSRVVNNLGKCNSCDEDDNRLSAVLIEAVKRNLLNGLGLESPPVFKTALPALPTPAAKHIQSHLQPAHTQKTLVLASGYGCSEDEGGYSLRFEMPASLEAGNIISASLWVHSVDPHPSADGCHMSYVSCAEQTNVRYIQDYGSNFTHTVSDSWVVMDLTWTVRSWLEVRELCQDVRLGCPRCNWSSDTHQAPFLSVVARTSTTGKQKKRNTDCNSSRTECCREDLVIVFKDIGWDWIKWPPTLNVHYCRGPCSRTTVITSSPLYSVVIEKMKEQHSDVNISSCCAPTSTSSASIIYRETEQTETLKILPGIIIASCGCI